MKWKADSITGTLVSGVLVIAARPADCGDLADARAGYLAGAEALLVEHGSAGARAVLRGRRAQALKHLADVAAVALDELAGVEMELALLEAAEEYITEEDRHHG